MDPTEVPMLTINGENKTEVVAEKKNQYLATVAGRQQKKRSCYIQIGVTKEFARLFVFGFVFYFV